MPTMPPAGADLLVIQAKPEAPERGDVAGILEHAALYGAWCAENEARLKAWQTWYRQNAGKNQDKNGKLGNK